MEHAVVLREVQRYTLHVDLFEQFGLVVDALNEHGVPFAVCGGVAVNLLGHVRATRDIDLLLPREQIDPVRDLVKPLGFVLRSGRIPFGEGTPNARELWRVSKAEGPSLLSLDLMVVMPVYERVFAGRVRTQWRGRSFDVVSAEGLIAMKRLAGRPQDLADIAALEAGAS
ncbi:MAG: nucleotidyl transferase AbiEii/AbiGii toxin family protein [Myxococcaceae bacterium]|nr:nucleotidyl transferase AbiEii/AbiGii toxin family protein [Myxococcaceae bacterium]